jgi:hypothetical protein
MEQQDLAETAAMYRRFADEELHGRSPLYEEFARGVADDAETIGFLLTLPPHKRQPNLLLAAVRHLCGTAADWEHFRRKLSANRDAVGAFMLVHSTQTNEPARCTSILPVLARLSQPLALIEVGASAGLCLLPDYYSYDYGRTRLGLPVRHPGPPVFACCVTGAVPLPTVMPRIVWRAGLDLVPIDVSDHSQTAWLETLVWPDQPQRLANLRAAMTIAATQQPRVVKGDLRTDLARLCREAPTDATLVVFHTAVLAYVASPVERQAFAAQAQALSRYWISNEAPEVFPEIAARVAARSGPMRFLLAVNGAPVAWAHPHGATLDWIA